MQYGDHMVFLQHTRTPLHHLNMSVPLQAGRAIRTLRGHTGRVNAVKWLSARTGTCPTCMEPGDPTVWVANGRLPRQMVL